MKMKTSSCGTVNPGKKGLSLILSAFLFLSTAGFECPRAIAFDVYRPGIPGSNPGPHVIPSALGSWGNGFGGFKNWLNTPEGKNLVLSLDPSLLSLGRLDFSNEGPGLIAVEPMARILKQQTSETDFVRKLTRINELGEQKQREIVGKLSSARKSATREVELQMSRLAKAVHGRKFDMEQITDVVPRLQGFRIYGRGVEDSLNNIGTEVVRYRVERVKSLAQNIFVKEWGGEITPDVLALLNEKDGLYLEGWTTPDEVDLRNRYLIEDGKPAMPDKSAPEEWGGWRRQAKKWRKGFIREGNSEASTSFAVELIDKAHQSPMGSKYSKVKVAVGLLKEAAIKGYPAAQHILGHIIAEGWGTPQNRRRGYARMVQAVVISGPGLGAGMVIRGLAALNRNLREKAERDAAFAIAGRIAIAKKNIAKTPEKNVPMTTVMLENSPFGQTEGNTEGIVNLPSGWSILPVDWKVSKAVATPMSNGRAEATSPDGKFVFRETEDREKVAVSVSGTQAQIGEINSSGLLWVAQPVNMENVYYVGLRSGEIASLRITNSGGWRVSNAEWNVSKAEVMPDGSGRFLAYSPDQNLMFLEGENGDEVFVVDAATGEPIGKVSIDGLSWVAQPVDMENIYYVSSRSGLIAPLKIVKQ